MLSLLRLERQVECPLTIELSFYVLNFQLLLTLELFQLDDLIAVKLLIIDVSVLRTMESELLREAMSVRKPAWSFGLVILLLRSHEREIDHVIIFSGGVKLSALKSGVEVQRLHMKLAFVL